MNGQPTIPDTDKDVEDSFAQPHASEEELNVIGFEGYISTKLSND